MAVKTEKKVKRPTKELIYEMRYGKPIYYRDYEKVLSGEKSLEEVMGSSKIQALIVVLLVEFLLSKLDRKRFMVLSNEAGFMFAPKSWRNLDIAVFEKDKLLEEGIDDQYTKTPPLLVVEIDTKADLKKYPTFMDYVYEKIDDLLGAGVERVIWIFTGTKKVLIAEKGKKWITQGWEESFELMEGIEVNLKELLKREGFKAL
ncbi:MAG: Uma2 family endonuclease [Aquificae bacterium]|nr:Uma2 family endonuclease [Aquificota bacterium]